MLFGHATEAWLDGVNGSRALTIARDSAPVHIVVSP